MSLPKDAEPIPDATLTILREPDLEWLETMVLTIAAEWRKGEHTAPKRFELFRPA